MSELTDLIWIEKYRPLDFEDLILQDKSLILKYLDKPETIPSFIFYSTKPGTGKTSTAKIIIKYLNCDSITINSSDERGIDTIREKIKLFSRTLSSNIGMKRCIFMDESDGLTRQAQDSLRNLMEEYSDNVFFIFTANDVNKIIEPIRSRCELISFEHPNKSDIFARVYEICSKEDIEINDENIDKLVNNYYPDIRSIIKHLQKIKIDDSGFIESEEKKYEEFLSLIENKNIKEIYETVYSNQINIMSYNKWMFDWLFKVYWHKPSTKLQNCQKIAKLLADTERSWNIGANLEVIFISNILEIMTLI